MEEGAKAWDNEWDFRVVCDELMMRVVAIILRWISMRELLSGRGCEGLGL